MYIVRAAQSQIVGSRRSAKDARRGRHQNDISCNYCTRARRVPGAQDGTTEGRRGRPADRKKGWPTVVYRIVRGTRRTRRLRVSNNITIASGKISGRVTRDDRKNDESVWNLIGRKKQKRLFAVGAVRRLVNRSVRLVTGRPRIDWR